MAVLGPRFRARALSSRGKRGPLLIAVRGPLTIMASPVAEHRLQTRRLSNCGSRAQPLRGMRDPPRPGLEPVSPAPAGRFPTTAPPGKPSLAAFKTVSLFLTFDKLIIMCPGESLFGFILFGTLLSSWIWRYVSFPTLGNLLAIIFSNQFSALFSSSFHFWTPIM